MARRWWPRVGRQYERHAPRDRQVGEPLRRFPARKPLSLALGILDDLAGDGDDLGVARRLEQRTRQQHPQLDGDVAAERPQDVDDLGVGTPGR
jgi:hypothetical protein